MPSFVPPGYLPGAPNAEALQMAVAGLVDHSHPAFPELFGDFVVRDGAADHGGHPQIQIWLSVSQSLLPVVLRGYRYRKHRYRKHPETLPETLDRSDMAPNLTHRSEWAWEVPSGK